VTKITDFHPLEAHLPPMKTHTAFTVRPSRAWILVLAFLLSAAGLFAEQPPLGASTEELVAAMVALDRAYIPALALSNQDKPEASAKALDVLKKTWASFEERFANAYPQADWRQGLQGVSAAIASAEKLEAKGDLGGAHTTLEEVRAIFSRLREERAVPYYIDYLNRYHERMEEVTGVTAGTSPSALTETQVRQVAALLPAAREAWEATLAARFDAALHGFTTARAQELQAAEQAVLRGIDKAAQAVKAGDHEAIVSAVAAMKPTFTRTFLMFGDFAPAGK
jgi:hypothetical protein